MSSVTKIDAYKIIKDEKKKNGQNIFSNMSSCHKALSKPPPGLGGRGRM
jgi:hypothetical protein